MCVGRSGFSVVCVGRGCNDVCVGRGCNAVYVGRGFSIVHVCVGRGGGFSVVCVGRGGSSVLSVLGGMYMYSVLGEEGLQCCVCFEGGGLQCWEGAYVLGGGFSVV